MTLKLFVSALATELWVGLLTHLGAGGGGVKLQRAESQSDRASGSSFLCFDSWVKMGEQLAQNVNNMALEAGGDPESTGGQDRTTCLIEAVRRGRKPMVAKLLSVPGINVNAKDLLGATALHYACPEVNISSYPARILAGLFFFCHAEIFNSGGFVQKYSDQGVSCKNIGQ